MLVRRRSRFCLMERSLPLLLEMELPPITSIHSDQVLRTSPRFPVDDIRDVPPAMSPLKFNQRGTYSLPAGAAVTSVVLVTHTSALYPEPVLLETGLLATADWSARFVSPAWAEDTRGLNPAPYLRRELAVRLGVKAARLYVTALGLYEIQLNGAMAGDHVLALIRLS